MKQEEKSKQGSFIPRHIEAVVLQEKKKDIPGPGSYEIKSLFEKMPGTKNTPFLSQAQRFSPFKSITPAPGSYNDPRTAFEHLTKISSVKRSPFGQTAVRFVPDFRRSITPGHIIAFTSHLMCSLLRHR
ncbi:sperm-tail PG-rich repeat-containing protein 2 [Polypterus senegalus]|uniref:sperm-tail PG-rich repeat-containing protein 2 n=1 Tax=Polypterus senegalus TaxID=55291 RepID=UPI0019648A44|nr:sperm-tail PG-rich repeat-containing protein 2 [Polypterus senegalus]